MKAFHYSESEWEAADPANFTGKGRVQRAASVADGPKLKTYRVEFEPAARTNWHVHSGVQLLILLTTMALPWARLSSMASSERPKGSDPRTHKEMGVFAVAKRPSGQATKRAKL